MFVTSAHGESGYIQTLWVSWLQASEPRSAREADPRVKKAAKAKAAAVVKAELPGPAAKARQEAARKPPVKQEATEALQDTPGDYGKCHVCDRVMDGVTVKVATKDGTGASLEGVEPAGCTSCVKALAEGWPGWTWVRCCKENLGPE